MRVVLACLIAKVAAVAAGAGSPSSDLTLGVDLGGWLLAYPNIERCSK